MPWKFVCDLMFHDVLDVFIFFRYLPDDCCL